MKKVLLLLLCCVFGLGAMESDGGMGGCIGGDGGTGSICGEGGGWDGGFSGTSTND